MAIFNSYVKLPEGIISLIIGKIMVLMGRTMMFIRKTHVFHAKTPTQEKTEQKNKTCVSGNNRNKLNGFCWCFSKFSRKPTESLETARRAWWVNSFMKRAAGLCGGAILSWRRLGKATGSWDLKKSQMGAITCNHKTRLGTRRCPILETLNIILSRIRWRFQASTYIPFLVGWCSIRTFTNPCKSAWNLL